MKIIIMSHDLRYRILRLSLTRHEYFVQCIKYQLLSLIRETTQFDLNRCTQLNNGSNEFTKLTEFSCKVSVASIANSFKHLKSGKASGVDGLAAEHFLYADDYVNVYLSLLFNSFFMP